MGACQGRDQVHPGVWPSPDPIDGHICGAGGTPTRGASSSLGNRTGSLRSPSFRPWPPVPSAPGDQNAQTALCQSWKGLQGPSPWQCILTLSSPTLSHLLTSLGTTCTIQLTCYKPQCYFKMKLCHYSRWRTRLTCQAYNINTKINVTESVKSAPQGQCFVIFCFVPSTPNRTWHLTDAQSTVLNEGLSK